MAIAAVSFYRGGTAEAVLPLARRMRAILRKYGVGYQVSRAQAEREGGAWMVVVRYADAAAYAQARAKFAEDPEHRQVVEEITKVVTFVRRDMFDELEL